MKLFRMAPPRGAIVNRHNADAFVIEGDPAKSVVFFPGLTRFAKDGELVGKILNTTENATFFAENLPGQESFPEFARTRSWHMLRKAEKRFLEHHKRVKSPVVLMGISTGALVAGILAARHPDKVRAVILISAARTLFRKVQNLLWFGATMQWILWPIHRWSNYWSIPAGSISDDPETEEAEGRPYHTRIPAWTGSSILYLQVVFGFLLSKIQCPVMIVSSKSDDVVPPEVAREILKDLEEPESSEDREWMFLEKAPHVPTIAERMDSEEREILELGIQRFVRRVWARPLKPMYPEERLIKRILRWFRVNLRRKKLAIGPQGVSTESLVDDAKVVEHQS